MIEFKIKNRWTGETQFTAEINCGEERSLYFKLGLAVKEAFKVGAIQGKFEGIYENASVKKESSNS